MRKNTLKKFTKDFGLPIAVLDEPYFSYFLSLYDDYCQIRKKYTLLDNAVVSLGGEDSFFSVYGELKDNIFSIKETPAYQRFITEDFSRFNVQNVYSQKDIFKSSNNGKHFISIDLAKANFQAFRFFDRELVLGAESYEELLRKYTQIEYFIESKYIRQVNFGNMNPKRQITIERFLIERVLQALITRKIIHPESIRVVCADEIVLEALEPTTPFIEDAVLKIAAELKLNLSVSCFWLKELSPHPFYVQEFTNKPGFKLKKTPLIYFAQAFKHYTKQPLNDYDLTFTHEGQLVRFLEPLLFEEEKV